MKCANRGLFVCLQEGAKRKKMEQQDSFDSSIFSNVLEWGIIMKYGLDRGKLLDFVVFILVWVVKKKKKKKKKKVEKGQIVLNMVLFSSQVYPQFWRSYSVSVRKEKPFFSLLSTLYPSKSSVWIWQTQISIPCVYLQYFTGDMDWGKLVL